VLFLYIRGKHGKNEIGAVGKSPDIDKANIKPTRAKT